jgi:hypothetical protein
MGSLAKFFKLRPSVSQSGVRVEDKPLAMRGDASGMCAYVEESVFCDLGWVRDRFGVRDDSGDALHPISGEVERVGYSRPEFLEITDSGFFI